MPKNRVGILDIQGSVEEHAAALRRLSIEPVFVKTMEDLERVDRLIMPGGESTTIGKLMKRFGLDKAIIARAHKGMPIWGTCAGAILLAKTVLGDHVPDVLGLMDITIERNAYGRQLDSFEGEVEFDFGGKMGRKNVQAVFIRAPKIVSVGKNVKILAKHDGEIVAAQEGNLLVTNFHPELSGDDDVLSYFFLSGFEKEF